MKNRVPFVVACWWVIMLTMIGVFLIVYAPGQPHISQRENRMLAGAPELTVDSFVSGEFMSGFDDWLTDNFFARDAVISLSESMLSKAAFGERQESVEKRLEKEMGSEDKDEGEKLLADVAINNEVEPIDYSDLSGGATDWGYEAAYSENDVDIEGKLAFYIKMTNGKGERLFTYSEENVAVVANTLNAYREILPEDGTVHYMVIPYSEYAYRWLWNQKKYKGWGSNIETEIQKKVVSGVYIHNIPQMLEKKLENGEYLYFRLDHHWTPLGAWTVVSNIMSRQGYPVVAYDEYDYTVQKNFYGSEYDPSDRDRMHRLVDSIDMIWPLEPATHYLVRDLTTLRETPLMDYDIKGYKAYMQGTRGPWRLIETGYNTGRTAMVLCDSFGTTFTPYLMPYYDKIVMTDLRPEYYSEADAGASVKAYAEQYGVDDVYIVVSTYNGPIRKYSQKYLMQYLY